MVKSLPRATPESVGIPSGALIKLYEALEKQEVHSCMVMRHGKVVSEGWWGPFRAGDPHILFSLSKSFCSTAVGLAMGEGKLTLDDRVLDFFPDLNPKEPSENLKQMRVRDLLTMSCGHETEAWPRGADWGEGDGLRKNFLAHPVPHQPGKKFFYNSLATYMCSAIVQKLTGLKVTEYLKPRLFEPLGIESHRWETSPEDIEFGGWGLHITTESIAKFGQLLLQDGWWEGKRLIPATWIAQASSKQVINGDGGTNDWGHGYGFQFWRCQTDCFRGDGAFGQLCVVIPRLDMVVAVTACVDDIGAELRCLWDELLPKVQSKGMPASKDLGKLKTKLSSLKLPLASGDKGAEPVSGLQGRYKVEGGGFSDAGFVLEASSVHIELQGKETQVSFVAGFKDWIRGRMYGGPIAASCAWKQDGSLAVKIRFTEGTYGEDWTCSFDSGSLKIVRRARGTFSGPDMPEVKGAKTD